ncbi:DUF6020 family protein [Bifidobacterium tibiigranuli]|jgi:hypothetical protein|uniref:DUF6020 family protein n=1 Tax=Bifidobacterium tibiigranuli TaxID=2172043 RepID=UPI001F3FC91B|nr:DUF6020 family protein [Bifidobacterium tibiigranuli]MCH3975941.1 DUF6020 family protein [Bifidobacterium tibiigranuli]MCH4204418.1 DUF6020 family protein [Bifidobacterium tibiigranuli]MCH4275061.1 DUF6020 family protein [Bifidobacterium tibiigranuli]MCI1673047.1 DUF6020 family protein [Bifidobacterium tibiigranuli]MCI1713147.1 DUF6020 family protein [Bifidobacterium tibiigranuli]
MTDASSTRLHAHEPQHGIPVASSPRTHGNRRTGAAPRARSLRIAAAARWALAIAACLWLSLCTAIGPLYWFDGDGLAQFSWINAVFGVLSFAIYGTLIVMLVRFGNGESLRGMLPDKLRRASHKTLSIRFSRPRWVARAAHSTPSRIAARAMHAAARLLVKATDRWWKIALILLIGWLWVPVTLLSAFGADIRSQIREFSWAYNQWTGLDQPYIGFFSFVPMDIYPTAHYLWPMHPTYLTDQHNIVLTVFYGGTTAISRALTGSNDWGLVALSAVQLLFAAFCCTSALDRFLNLPWLRDSARIPALVTSLPERFRPRDFAHPEYGMEAAKHSAHSITSVPIPTPARAGAGVRTAMLLFFLCCPLVLFSTISLTKSPVFAFAFVWWFGAGYELHMTSEHTAQRHGQGAARPRNCTLVAFAVSSIIMLISAKYAWYILVLEIVLLLIADRKRWKTYAVALILPVLLVHGALTFLTSSGAVIPGDPIESRGVQLQQIARVAKLDPGSIPQQARDELAPVFNLDQMAAAYTPYDTDPVKSSGIQSKKVSYRWRTVTETDMTNFNRAWLRIVAANPRVTLDAFLAKCYGYFDVADRPYVAMDYYVTSSYVMQWSTWIRYWQPGWRQAVVHNARSWSDMPVLGWVTHGNLYVVLTLLIGAAEVVLRRWRTLVWHMPLLLLMGVLIDAPANNFERHMLPLAFVFGFLALTFWRESQAGSRTGSQEQAQHGREVPDADEFGPRLSPASTVD